MAAIDTFKGWAETIRQDVDAFKAVLEADAADRDARKLAASALTYLVSRMDLIPDWNEGIGVLDDVMVLRVCAQLSKGHQRGALPASAESALERLNGEAAAITSYLGAAIYEKLKAYCVQLGEQSVRGRTPAEIVDDEALRAQLYVEIDDELKRSVPIVIADPADADLRLKSYLVQKLQ